MAKRGGTRQAGDVDVGRGPRLLATGQGKIRNPRARTRRARSVGASSALRRGGDLHVLDLPPQHVELHLLLVHLALVLALLVREHLVGAGRAAGAAPHHGVADHVAGHVADDVAHDHLAHGGARHDGRRHHDGRWLLHDHRPVHHRLVHRGGRGRRRRGRRRRRAALLLGGGRAAHPAAHLRRLGLGQRHERHHQGRQQGQRRAPELGWGRRRGLRGRCCSRGGDFFVLDEVQLGWAVVEGGGGHHGTATQAMRAAPLLLCAGPAVGLPRASVHRRACRRAAARLVLAAPGLLFQRPDGVPPVVI
mmetsp:Transcript_99332/g.281182  ORF Transcript_99332/g.281182 Transcript_99332/m.281182 type:complete len:305 (-) Transcript_99332:1662-2576(-)